jgi:hypothetical protein
MKRVLAQSTEKTGLKPVYGSRGESPFYDPYDAHIHKWTSGVLLAIQDHKDPGYKQNEANIDRNSNTYKIRKYCTICHELLPTNSFSKTSGTTISSINKLDPLTEETYENIELGYDFSNVFDMFENKESTRTGKNITNSINRENLFSPREGLFCDYVLFKE